MVEFGNHYRATVDEREREKLRSFYTEVLECSMQASDGITADIPANIDLFFFSSGHCYGVEYVPPGSPTLALTEHYLACWMELRTGDVAAVKEKCLAHGAVAITDFWDSGHFYFHAPGGQVYRLVDVKER